MEAVNGEPCAAAAGQPGPLDEPPPPPLDCSSLKSLSPALHGLLLAGTPLTAKRDEIGLAEVPYLDTETLPLAAAAAAPAEPAEAPATVNCSVLMGYLRKPERQSEPAGRSLTPVHRLSPAESDADDPGEPAVAVPTQPPLDLSRTCVVCGVVAESSRWRSLRAAEPLPASGSAYLAFVGGLLDAELEPGALQRLEVICLDCHDLLVTIDDLEQRVAAMRNSVRSQFRAWWRAGGDGAVPAAAAATTPEKRRRSSRRAAACQPLAADPTDTAELDQPADDDYRPNKRRKARSSGAPKSGLRRARSGALSEKKIEKSKNLVCTHCPFYTFDRDALQAHIASVHDGEKTHRCEVCQKRFTYEDSLKRHMNQHQHFNKAFRCEPCGEQFVNRSELLLHRQLYLHGAQGSPPPPAAPAPAPAAQLDVGDFAIQFTCPDCALLHTMRDNEKDQVLACGCGRQFDLAAALRLFPGKYGGSCLACRRECGDHDAMETHLTAAHGTGEVVCLLCGCGYSQLDHFKLHALFHSTLTEHACQQCAFRTYNPAQLASHEHQAPAADTSGEEAIVAAVRSHPVGRRGRPRKDARPAPPATTCPICGKELSSLTNLKNHMVLHSDVHAHKCPVCGRRFKLRKYLNTHLSLHTGVRQFKCTLCEKDFNQKCELNRHMRYHNGDMKHVCEFCGKRFREANGLKFHRQVHTGERPFACDQCGIALRSAAKLRIHQRKHTGEKPYKCEYCGKDFAYKYNFDCHLRLHTGERRFRCSVCQTGFERRDKLQAHEQSCTRRMEALAATSAAEAATPSVHLSAQPGPQQLPLQPPHHVQPQQPQQQLQPQQEPHQPTSLPPPLPPPPQGHEHHHHQPVEPQPYSWTMEELQPH